jgi:hypothetical protein
VDRPSDHPADRNGCDQHLYWTETNGRTWHDITPTRMPTHSIGQVFFLDRLHGWILSTDAPREQNDAIFYLLSTSNGGKTWSVLQFRRTAYNLMGDMSPTQLFFSDPQHGWILLNWSMMHGATDALLATVDGGRSLNRLPDPPGPGPLDFISATDGWLIGQSPGQDIFAKRTNQIWTTHDGGLHWKTIPVPLPAGSSSIPSFTTLKMASARDGILTAETHPSEVVTRLFSCTTHDAGGTWHCSQFDAYSATPSIVDMHIVWSITNYNANRVEEVMIRRDDHVISPALPAALPSGGFLGPTNFIDDSDGWATYVDLAAAGLAQLNPVFAPAELLSTADGGKTFHVITPPAAVRDQHLSNRRAGGAFYGVEPVSR